MLQSILTDIHKLDWTPDASFASGRTVVRYVTTAKIKRNLAPVLDRHGAYLNVNVNSIESTSTNLTRICGSVELVTTTGDILMHSDLISEGSSEVKGVTYATTNLIRLFALNNFLIVDGIESDDVPDSHPQIIEATTINPQPTVQIHKPVSSGGARPMVYYAAERALQAMSASGIAPNVLEEAKGRYNAIESEQDATSFLAWYQKVKK